MKWRVRVKFRVEMGSWVVPGNMSVGVTHVVLIQLNAARQAIDPEAPELLWDSSVSAVVSA